MRNLLALVGLVVVFVAGFGWYRGWYQLSTEQGSDGHRIVNVDVNTPKVVQDEQKAQQFITNHGNGNTNPQQQQKKVDGQPKSGERDGNGVPVLPKR